METTKMVWLIVALDGKGNLGGESYNCVGDGNPNRYTRYLFGNNEGNGWGCGLGHCDDRGSYKGTGWSGSHPYIESESRRLTGDGP